MVHCVFMQCFSIFRKTITVITCSTIFCSTAFFPCYEEGSVRVANGTYIYRNFGITYAGRVEVCYNGSYGSVCDVDWDEEDAIVVCRRRFGLGYSKYSSVLDGAGKIFQYGVLHYPNVVLIFPMLIMCYETL